MESNGGVSAALTNDCWAWGWDLSCGYQVSIVTVADMSSNLLHQQYGMDEAPQNENVLFYKRTTWYLLV